MMTISEKIVDSKYNMIEFITIIPSPNVIIIIGLAINLNMGFIV